MKGRVTNTGYRDDSPDRFNDYNVIPSQHITMKGVSQPIMMFPIKNNKVSNPVQGIPGEEYYFPGADGVVEMPLPPGRMSYERKAKGGSTEAKMRDVLSKVAYGKGGSTMTPELAAKILKTGSIYGKTLTSSQKNKFADLAAEIGIDENGDPIEEEKDNSSDVVEYKRGGSSPKTKKKSSKTTSKNVYTAINQLFARNTTLYGSGGKEFYQPQMKQGGWLDGHDLPKAQDGWFNTLYAKLNPYNWGVPDYSGSDKVGEVDWSTANIIARARGDKEFMHNNKRYAVKDKKQKENWEVAEEKNPDFFINYASEYLKKIHPEDHEKRYKDLLSTHYKYGNPWVTIEKPDIGLTGDYGRAYYEDDVNQMHIYGVNQNPNITKIDTANLMNDYVQELLHSRQLKDLGKEGFNKHTQEDLKRHNIYYDRANNKWINYDEKMYDDPKSIEGVHYTQGPALLQRTLHRDYDLEEKPLYKQYRADVLKSFKDRDFHPYINQNELRALQKGLSEAGYDMSESLKKDGTYDGIYGEQTKYALDNWQKGKVHVPNIVKKSDKILTAAPTYNKKMGGWLDTMQKGGTEENPVELPEVKTTPWTGSILNYEDANPKERYINDLKQAYLNNANTQGLNKLAGLSMENFPGNVEQEYANEYLYKRNNSIAPKIIDSYSKSGDRTEWVDKLTEEEKDIITNSDYRFLLEPNAFDTSYAGAAKLLNAIGMPIEEGDAKSLGITEKEDKNIGKLNLLDFLNVPGQALGSALRSPNLPGNPNNAYMNNSMMKGLQGYHDPKRLAGEEILANPLNWTMAYDAPALGYGIAKGIKSLANFSDAFAPNLSGIGDDLLGRSRVDSPMPGIKSQLAKAPTSVGTSNYIPFPTEDLYIDPNAQTFKSYSEYLPPEPPLNQDPFDLFNPFLEENLAELNQSTPSILTSIKGNLKGGLSKTGSKLKVGLNAAESFTKNVYDKTKNLVINPISALDPYAAGTFKNEALVMEGSNTLAKSLSDADKAFLGLPNKNSKLSPLDRIAAKNRFNENISDKAYKFWAPKIDKSLNTIVNPQELREAHREAAELFKDYPIESYAGKGYEHLLGLYIRNKFADRIFNFGFPNVSGPNGKFLPMGPGNMYSLLQKEVIPAKTFAEAALRRLGKKPKFLSNEKLNQGLSSGDIKVSASYKSPYYENADEGLRTLSINPHNPFEHNTISAYSRGYDDIMNSVLREQTGDVGRALNDPEYAKLLDEQLTANMNLPESKGFYLQEAEKLNKLIQKNKIDSDVFSHVRRGASNHEVELVDPETLMLTGEKRLKSELKEGEAFLDRGFGSTTVSSGADNPTGPIKEFTNFGAPETSEIIMIPKGKKLSGAAPNANSVSEFRHETEIVLPKNLIRRVTKINEPKGHNGFYEYDQTKFVTEILNPYKKGGSTGWLDRLPKAQVGLNNTQKPVVDLTTPEDLVNMKVLGYPIYHGQKDFYNKFKDAKTYLKTEANPKGSNSPFFYKDEGDAENPRKSWINEGWDSYNDNPLQYNIQEGIYTDDPDNPICEQEQCTARANRAIGSMYFQTGDNFYENPDITKKNMGVTYTTADAPTAAQQQQYDYMMGDKEFGSLDAWDIVQQAKKKTPKNVLYSSVVDVPKEVADSSPYAIERYAYIEKYRKNALKAKDVWKKYDIPIGSYINIGESSSDDRKDIIAGSHTLRVVGYTDEGEPLVADYGKIVPLSKSMYADDPDHDFIAGVVTVPGKEKYTYKWFKEQARAASKPNTTPYVKDIKSEEYGDRYKTFHDNIVKEKNYIAAKLGVDSKTYDQYAKIALTLGGVETDFGKGKVFNLPFLDSMGESTGVAQVTEANVAEKYKSTLSKYKDDPEAYNAMSALLYVKELDNYKDKWLKSGEKAGERPFARTDESSLKNIVRGVQGRKQQGYINSDMPLPGAIGKTGQDVFRYTDANDKPREIKLPYKQFWQSDADYEEEVNEVLKKEDPTLRFSDKGDKGGRTIYKKTKGNTIPKTLEDFVYYAWQAPNAVAYGDAQGTSTYYKKAKAIQAKLFGEKLAEKKLGGASTWLDKYQVTGENFKPVAESTSVKKPRVLNLPKDINLGDKGRATLNYMYAKDLANKYNLNVDSSGNVLKNIGLNSEAYFNPITRTINYKHNPKRDPKVEYAHMIMHELPHAMQSDSMGVLPFLKNTIMEGAYDYLFEEDPEARYSNTSKIEGHAHNILQDKLYKDRMVKLYPEDLKYFEAEGKHKYGGWLDDYK
jgi:hypothetical protein